MVEREIELAERVAEAVRMAGGHAYYVGGFVRDRLLGIGCKDVDIEIHGISPEKLKEILSQFGQPFMKGSSFGVFGLRGYDLDIAEPRRERATGTGHKDFTIDIDPYIGIRAAAGRRDFTINAVMQDILTGAIEDPFHGVEDLKAGRIRHVNDTAFTEDPLRILRAAQFAARFGFTIDDETIRLCRTVSLDNLSRERVCSELEKAFLKSDQPSVFFNVLDRMNRLNEWFPEIKELQEVPQPPKHHPEGNVWNHTMQVLDEAAKLKHRAEKPIYFMYSALCHDLGKLTATQEKDGIIHAYHHETEGLIIAEKFLGRITAESALRKYVLNMVLYHMKPNVVALNSSRAKTMMKMFDDSVCPNDLLLLAEADYLGCCGNPADREALKSAYEPIAAKLESGLKDYHKMMEQPYISGNDLIDAGLKPGRPFHEAMEYAHKLQLAGVDRESGLKQTLAFMNKKNTAHDS